MLWHLCFCTLSSSLAASTSSGGTSIVQHSPCRILASCFMIVISSGLQACRLQGILRPVSELTLRCVQGDPKAAYALWEDCGGQMGASLELVLGSDNFCLLRIRRSPETNFKSGMQSSSYPERKPCKISPWFSHLLSVPFRTFKRQGPGYPRACFPGGCDGLSLEESREGKGKGRRVQVWMPALWHGIGLT